MSTIETGIKPGRIQGERRGKHRMSKNKFTCLNKNTCKRCACVQCIRGAFVVCVDLEISSDVDDELRG